MANSVVTQIQLDGPRNVIVKITGVLDTSDVAYAEFINPATLQGIDSSGAIKAAGLILKHINWSVKEGLALNFFWGGATPTLLAEYVKSGNANYTEFDGLINPRVAGWDGGVGLSTTGYAVGTTMQFTAVLTFVKTQT